MAEHYYHFGGVSPINQQCRDLLAAVDADFAAHGVDLPTYWGNRNWQPMLADTVAQMRDDGVTSRAGASPPARTAATRPAGSTGRTSPRPAPRSARAPR